MPDSTNWNNDKADAQMQTNDALFNRGYLAFQKNFGLLLNMNQQTQKSVDALTSASSTQDLQTASRKNEKVLTTIKTLISDAEAQKKKVTDGYNNGQLSQTTYQSTMVSLSNISDQFKKTYAAYQARHAILTKQQPALAVAERSTSHQRPRRG